MRRLFFSLTIFLYSILTQHTFAQCNFTIRHSNTTDNCLYAVEEVVWKNLVNATTLAPGNTITVSGTNNEVFDAGGLSVNQVRNNGWATAEIVRTDTEEIFGLSNAPSTTPSFSRAQFSFYFLSNGTFRIYESGNYRNGGDGTYVIGDVFKIHVDRGIVKYYKNGAFHFKSSTTPTLPLVVDATLKRKNTATPAAALKSVSVYNGADGNFTTSIASAGTGATYQWLLNGAPTGTNAATYSNTSLNSADLLTCQITVGTGGCVASGTVLTSNAVRFTTVSASAFGTYYASNNANSTGCLVAAEDAVFTSLVNTSAVGNDLTKNEGNTSLSDASAFSLNAVSNNGYAEATINEVATNRVFGLSSSNSGISYTTIQYAMQVRGDGTIDIYESGSVKFGNVASYASGTVLKIAVENNVVRYYVNNTLEYISSVTPALPLYVDVAFTSLSGTLDDITITNGSIGSFTATGSPLGASPVYTWKVNGVTAGVTSATYADVSLQGGDLVICEVTPGLPGCVSVPAQTFDLASTPFKGTFYISANSAAATCAETREQVSFTNIINAEATGNDIEKVADNLAEAYNAGAVSLNSVYNNGYVETTILQLGTSRAFGLSTTNSDPLKASILFGIEIQNGNRLQVFEGASDRGSSVACSLNDVIRISIEQNVVRYYQNGTLLYTSATTPVPPLIVDVALQTRSPRARLDDLVIVNGASAVFTAVSTGAGTAPTFQWQMNGAPTGSTGSSFSHSLLAAGDQITCLMRPDLAGCSATDYTSNSITVTQVAGASSPSTTWTGAVSSDWFNSSNWSNGIPRGYHKVTIPPSGNNPSINVSTPTASAYNVTINAGAQLGVTGTNALIVFNEWVNAGTFNAANSTVTFQTCTNNKNEIVSTNPQAFYKIVLNNANHIDLNGQMRINGEMTFLNGSVNYKNAATNVTFSDNALATGHGSTRYIRGKVLKEGDDAFDFPIGKNALYRPIGISSPSVSDVYTAEYINGSAHAIGVSKAAMLSTISQCEYWSLTKTGASSAQVKLMWVSAECPLTYVVNPADLTVAWWNGTQWSDVSPASISGTAAGGSITSTTTSGGGYFSLASYASINPLPIELQNFMATGGSAGVELTWETLTEWNTYYFQIERADASLRFDSVGVVAAAGESNLMLRYRFNDRYPLSGKNYYRLKTVDINGDSEFSPVVVYEKTSEDIFRVFPNPVKRGQRVHFTAQGTIKIYDPHRPEILRQNDGDGFADTGDLAPGTYIAVDNTGVFFRFVVF